MTGLRRVSAAALLVFLGGCAAAPMALPPQVAASTEQLKISGMSGWQDGRFRLGASEGRFRQRAGQEKILDTFVHNAGSGSFEIAGPEFGGSAGGRCAFAEGEIDAGIAVVPHGRMTYRCRFQRNGRALDGGMFLAEVPNGSGIIAGRSRAGEYRAGGTSLQIRAIHHFATASLPTGMPLGYAFSIDGRQVGAIDLNGSDKTIYAPREPGAERDAVLMASLALAVFRDPGDD